MAIWVIKTHNLIFNVYRYLFTSLARIRLEITLASGQHRLPSPLGTKPSFRLPKRIIGEGYQVMRQGRLEVKLKECGISVHLLARLRVSGRQLNKMTYD